MLLCCIPNLVLHYKLNEMPHHSHNLGVLIPQSKSLSQPGPEFSTHQILIYPPHTTARVLAPKTPNNIPYPRPGILLPKTPKIPSPLKPSAPPHQPSLGLSLSNLGHQLLINPKSHYLPGLPSSGPHLQRLCILPSTVSSPTSPSSTMTISALGEFLTTPFHPTLPSLLPPGRLWHQHDLLPEPQSTTCVYEQEVKPQGNRE